MKKKFCSGCIHFDDDNNYCNYWDKKITYVSDCGNYSDEDDDNDCCDNYDDYDDDDDCPPYICQQDWYTVCPEHDPDDDLADND